MYFFTWDFNLPEIYHLLLTWDRFSQILKRTLSSGKGATFRPVEKYSCLLALHFLLMKGIGREDVIGMRVPALPLCCKWSSCPNG